MSSANTIETLHFDPQKDLTLHRCLSPTSSLRGCYVRSRPTSHFDESDPQTKISLGESLVTGINHLSLSSLDDDDDPFRMIPPESELPSYASATRTCRSSRHSRMYGGGGGQYDVDTVSVITTRSTISTFRHVRNPEATPPMLRQCEKGKRLRSRSTMDLLGCHGGGVLPGLKEQKEEEGKKGGGGGWKGGRRLKERFSFIFSGRKENAGILDRGVDAGKKLELRKKSFSFRRVGGKSGGGEEGLVMGRNVKDSLELARTRSRKSSGFDNRRSGDGIEIRPMKRMVPRDARVRHSRSFAGFRDSAMCFDDVPPVPPISRVTVAEEEMVDEDIDEITREAAQVNRGVRRNFSYEQDRVDE
ncbi:hypothetical protein L218DRAFT_990966 [Marasmius fiardii PR-910]|nr:hypothetical protein L218DRAFT_990966 [Marasmius fiardii PR-910]